MITANVIHRVFQIKVDQTVGTAFTIEKDDREYLVTAKHVAETITAGRGIEVFGNAAWTPLQIELVGHASGDSDITVLASNRLLTPAGLPMPVTSKGIIYGQDVYFLGFPYGYLGKHVFGSNEYPLPFVKRATLSLFDGTTYLLDGHNNPGFSGGPVVWKAIGSQEWNVGAVVSGYRYVDEQVYADTKETPLTYKYNTGIIESCGVEVALDLIAAKPVGCPIAKVA